MTVSRVFQGMRFVQARRHAVRAACQDRRHSPRRARQLRSNAGIPVVDTRHLPEDEIGPHREFFQCARNARDGRSLGHSRLARHRIPRRHAFAVHEAISIGDLGDFKTGASCVPDLTTLMRLPLKRGEDGLTHSRSSGRTAQDEPAALPAANQSIRAGATTSRSTHPGTVPSPNAFRQGCAAT